MKTLLLSCLLAVLAGCSGTADYTVIEKAKQFCGEGKIKGLYVNAINGGDVRINCLNGTTEWTDKITWKHTNYGLVND